MTPSTWLVVKPMVFRMPTSRARSRTDMAMVFAETSRMLKTTAPQILSRNTLTLPRKARKLRLNCSSDSVLVSKGELWNISSTALAT